MLEWPQTAYASYKNERTHYLESLKRQQHIGFLLAAAMSAFGYVMTAQCSVKGQ